MRTFIDGFTDANWAGCLSSRKSTSGLALRWGSHTLKTSSSTQQAPALSVGESEFYALVRGASSLFGLQALFKDFGIQVYIRLWSDSSSARGTSSRRGAGNIRHIHTQTLWIQHKVTKKELTLHKVDGSENMADLFTKVLSWPTIAKFLDKMGLEFMTGRATSALDVQCALTDP